MKKPLAIRVDPLLLAAARECAALENRSLTNFIETVLRGRIEAIRQNAAAAATSASDFRT